MDSLFAIVRVDKFQLSEGGVPSDETWRTLVTVKGIMGESGCSWKPKKVSAFLGAGAALASRQVAKALSSCAASQGAAQQRVEPERLSARGLTPRRSADSERDGTARNRCAVCHGVVDETT